MGQNALTDIEVESVRKQKDWVHFRKRGTDHEESMDKTSAPVGIPLNAYNSWLDFKSIVKLFVNRFKSSVNRFV